MCSASTFTFKMAVVSSFSSLANFLKSLFSKNVTFYSILMKFGSSLLTVAFFSFSVCVACSLKELQKCNLPRGIKYVYMYIKYMQDYVYLFLFLIIFLDCFHKHLFFNQRFKVNLASYLTIYID